MGPVAVRVVSALVLGLGSFLVVQAITSPSPSATSGSVAWIDHPLDGTEMMPAVVQVTGHGTDPSGVASLALMVDGATVQTVETFGSAIETGHFNWQATPGQHQLVVRLMSVSGNEVSSAPVSITILGRMPETEPDPTTTTPPETTTTLPSETTSTSGADTTTTTTTGITTTTTLATTTTGPTTTTTTTTPTTTTTTCPLSAPTLVAPANGSIFEPGSLQWSYTGCTATAFVAELAEDPRFGVGFHTITVQQGTPLRWNVQPLDLPLGTTIYWRVRAVNGPLTGPWSTVWTFSRG